MGSLVPYGPAVLARTTLTTAAVSGAGFYEAGLGRFLVSPGFGGVAVLLGGAVAYLAARRTSRDTRAETSAAAERAREDRWWATITWFYDRTTSERVGARLPVDVALDLLDRLSRQAQTELETETVLGLIQIFRDERRPG